MQADKVMEAMNESQLRQLAKSLVEDLKNIQSVMPEITRLRRENDSFKLKAEHSTFLLKENCELKKMLKTRPDYSKECKEAKKRILEQEEQLEKISKDRDDLRKQMTSKAEYRLLRKENRDLEAALSTQEQEHRQEIHIFQLEVEKMQRKAGELQEKNDRLLGEKTTFQEERHKLKKQMIQLQLKLDELQLENNSLGKKVSKTCNLEHSKKVNELYLKNKCSELEQQLEAVKKELRTKYPHYFEDCEDPPRHMTESDAIVQKCRDKLKDKSKQMDKKELQLKEKDRLIEEMKQDMSKRAPPEMLELIPKYKWVIREQGDKNKALTAQLRMYQSKYEESENKKEKLVANIADVTKLYLKEKTEHTELWAVLATRSGDMPLLHSSHGLEKQAGGHQVDTARPTQTATALPPIPNKYRAELGVALGHTGSATFQSDTTVSKNIGDKSGGKSRNIVLPSMSDHSYRTQSTQGRKNIFMTN